MFAAENYEPGDFVRNAEGSSAPLSERIVPGDGGQGLRLLLSRLLNCFSSSLTLRGDELECLSLGSFYNLVFYMMELLKDYSQSN